MVSKKTFITVFIIAIALIFGGLIFLITNNGSQSIENPTAEELSILENAFILPPIIIDGDTVYINDSRAYISATPSTLVDDGWVYYNVTSKQASLDVDLIIGTKTNHIQPKKIQYYNPQIITTQFNYTCDYEFNYTLDPKYFWCYYEENINGSIITTIVKEGSFDSGDIPSKTAYWETEELIEWYDLPSNFEINIINYTFYKMDTWYYIENIPLQEDQTRIFRIYYDASIGKGFHKYWLAFKPSSKTLQEAISSNTLYALDPWWDLSWNYKKPLNFSLTGNPTNNDFQARINLTWNESYKNDFSDIRFVDYSDDSTVLEHGIQDKVDGEWADIWIRLNDNVTSANQSLAYMYYNNSGASSTSNPNTTFNLWDTFNSANTTKWNEVTGTLSVSGGIATIQSDMIVSYDNWSDYMIIYEMQLTEALDDASGLQNPNSNGGTDTADRIFWGINSGARDFRSYNDGASSGGNGGSVGGTDLVQVVRANTSANLFLLNNGLAEITITNIPDDNLSIGLRDWGGAGYATSWVRVRGYNDSVVSYSLGLEEETTSPAEIILNNPSDNYRTGLTNFTFNATITDNVEVSEVTFFLNGVVNDTNSSLLNGTYIWERNLSEGSYTWSIGAEDDEVYITNSSTYSIIVDAQDPIISIGNITNLTTLSLPINSTLQLNGTDTNIDNCYYNHTNNATYTVISCGTWFNVTWATSGSKTVQYCANDTVGNENCSSSDLFIYHFETLTSDVPDPTGEGIDVQYDFQVNETENGIGTTTANIIHNGTTYAVSSIFSNGTQYKFQKNITMLNGWGSSTGQNVSFYWEYNVTGAITGQQTSTENTTVYSMDFDDCSVFGDVIINWTLYDEELATEINGSLGSNIELDIEVFSEDNTSLIWEHNETWTNASLGAVCVPSGLLAGNINYKIDFIFGFDSTDRVWEFFYLDWGNLNSTKVFNSNTTGNISLYDLASADSTSFLFGYLNVDGLEEVGSLVHVFRKYIGDGASREVERSKADESGDTVIHLVEEDVIYYFMITLDSIVLYTSQTYTALCQTTPCELTLEASGDFIEFDEDYDLVDNGGYSVTLDDETRTVNLTYDLTSSSEMNLTVYSYDGNGTYESLVSDAETGTSGTITLTVPQSAGNYTFFAGVYQDGQFIRSKWINFENDLGFYIGDGLAIFLAFLIVLTLGLIAITEGTGTVVIVVLGVAVTGFLGLVRLKSATGYGLLIYLVCAGAIIVYKLSRRGRD